MIRPELLSSGNDVDFVIMTNSFIICCKKLPPILEMHVLYMGGSKLYRPITVTYIKIIIGIL